VSAFVINSYAFGGAAFSPANISGLQLWLDATVGLYDATTGGSEVTTDGSAVARWEDQSGNGYDVTQGTAASQPVLKTSQQNGLNVIRFDGTSDHLFGATNFTITGSSNRSVFAVTKRTDNVTRYIVSWGINSTGRFSGFTTEYYLRFQGTTKGYTNQGSDGSWTVWSVIGGGSTLNDYDAYFDGGTVAAPNAENNTSASLDTGASAIYVGKPSFLNLNYLSSDLAEILIYDSALSTSDREAVRDYLNAKWAVY